MAQISGKFRLTFMLFNLLYFAMGASMLAVGITIILRIARYGFFTRNLYNGAAGIFIAAGSLKMVFGIYGGLSYFARKKILFALYTLGVIVLMVVTFVAAIVAFLRRDAVYGISTGRLETAFVDYATLRNASIYANDIVQVQGDFNCCGFNQTIIPPSGLMNCNTTRDTIGTIQIAGCLPYLSDYIAYQLYYLGAIAMAYGVFEVTAMVVAMQQLEGIV